jgi:hypothetical protein
MSAKKPPPAEGWPAIGHKRMRVLVAVAKALDLAEDEDDQAAVIEAVIKLYDLQVRTG